MPVVTVVKDVYGDEIALNLTHTRYALRLEFKDLEGEVKIAELDKGKVFEMIEKLEKILEDMRY